MSQLIGGLLQLQRGQRALQAAGCLGMRLPFDLSVPQLQHVRRGFASVAPRLDRQCSQAEQRRLRRVEQGFEQREQFRDEAFDGGASIQVAGVGHVAVDQCAIIRDVQRQVEMRALFVEGIFADLQPGQPERGFLLEDHVLVELGLEQRVVAQAALGCQLIDQLLEGHVLMGLRTERGIANLRQQVKVAQAFIHLAAQNLSIDEETDQAFGFSATAVGIRHADADITLPGLARQKQRKAGQHQHEQGHALRARKGVEPPRQVYTEIETQVLALIALRGRTREIRCGVQQRLLVTQLVTPVVQLTCALARLQPAALPDRIIGVLQRQLRQRGLAAFAVRLIAVHELLNHHIHRPAVGDDVVHADDQHMLVIREAKQVRAQQRPRAQIKRLTRDCGHLQRQLGIAQFDIGQTGQINAYQCDCLVVQQHLLCLIAIGVKHRAQHLVAFDQMIERAAQRRLVQRAAQTQAGGHLVRVARRIELPEEQQTLLSEGQRNSADIMPTDRHRQQAEILAFLAQPGEELLALLQRQADKTFRNACSSGPGHAPNSSSESMNWSMSLQSLSVLLSVSAATSTASSLSSGFSNRVRSGRLMPSCVLIRAMTCAASSECPPSSKK